MDAFSKELFVKFCERYIGTRRKGIIAGTADEVEVDHIGKTVIVEGELLLCAERTCPEWSGKAISTAHVVTLDNDDLITFQHIRAFDTDIFKGQVVFFFEPVRLLKGGTWVLGEDR